MPSATSTPNVILTALPSTKQPPKSPSIVLADAEAQWLFTETELSSSPSILGGMKPEDERELRVKGLNFILQVGIMLKIQQLTLYTAGVFFNRFLMRQSMQKSADNPKPLHHYQVAATALMLATKTDETIRRTKDIIIACCRVAQKNPHLVIDEQNKDYWKWRDTLLLNEDVLLESLCFDLTVESPYKLLYDMLKGLHVEGNRILRNSAWAFLCDSLMTNLCLLHTSRTIAAAALWCGARHSDTILPGEGDRSLRSDEDFGSVLLDESHVLTPWWETAHVRVRDVKKACNYMADLYEFGIGSGKSTTPNGSDGSQGLSQSQHSKDIYIDLRTEISDDEEDGELVDDEEEEEAAASKHSNGHGSEHAALAESRGVKRPRSSSDGG